MADLKSKFFEKANPAKADKFLDDSEKKPENQKNNQFEDILKYVKGDLAKNPDSKDLTDSKTSFKSSKKSSKSVKAQFSFLNTPELKKISENRLKKEVKKQSKKRRLAKFLRRFAAIISVISIASLVFGVYFLRQINTFTGDVFAGSSTTDIVQALTTGFSSEAKPLAGQSEDGKSGRTNFLLIGKDSAAGLTDTIMIASYYYDTKQIATVNIPRDFWVRPQSLWGMKINAINPFAESQLGKGKGSQVLADFLSKELNIPIHYSLMVNFDGLKSVIDEIGGVTVNVDKRLVDCQYPTDNYSGYMRPCPTFEAGEQNMDGRTALIYSRSRYSTSDFDRSRRQSKVVESILLKITNQMKSGELTVNPNRVAAFLQIFGSNVQTSVQISEIPSFYKTFKDAEIKGSFHRLVWQNGNGFLCPALDTRGSVVVYCDGTEPTGSDRAGPSKKLARESIQNLLQQAIDQEKNY